MPRYEIEVWRDPEHRFYKDATSASTRKEAERIFAEKCEFYDGRWVTLTDTKTKTILREYVPTDPLPLTVYYS